MSNIPTTSFIGTTQLSVVVEDELTNEKLSEAKIKIDNKKKKFERKSRLKLELEEYSFYRSPADETTEVFATYKIYDPSLEEEKDV